MTQKKRFNPHSLIGIDINETVNDINKEMMAEASTSSPASSAKEDADESPTLPPIQTHTTGNEEYSSSSKKNWQPLASNDPGNIWWNSFVSYCNKYQTAGHKSDRTTVGIDVEILNTFRSCNINKTCPTHVINAILRSFIELNKENLQQFVKAPVKTLL